MISYVRTPATVQEKHKWSDTHFEATLLCATYSTTSIGTDDRSLSFTPVQVFGF